MRAGDESESFNSGRVDVVGRIEEMYNPIQTIKESWSWDLGHMRSWWRPFLDTTYPPSQHNLRFCGLKSDLKPLREHPDHLLLYSSARKCLAKWENEKRTERSERTYGKTEKGKKKKKRRKSGKWTSWQGGKGKIIQQERESGRRKSL